MLHVHLPDQRRAARRYAAEVLLGEFLGQELRIHWTDPADGGPVAITGPGPGRLTMADGLLGTAESDWLALPSLPEPPLPRWEAGGLGANLVDERVPVLYTAGGPAPVGGSEAGPGGADGGAWWRERTVDGAPEIHLAADLFGGAFHMLTRYEECVLTDRDLHGRFPAAASLAVRDGFLERPLVNEYAELLWSSLVRLWPGLERPRRDFRLLPSHDIDIPFTTAWPMLRSAAADLLKRGRPGAAARNGLHALRRAAGLASDPAVTYAWLMDVAEEAGVRSAFFFKAIDEDLPYEDPYAPEDPRVAGWARAIRERGHELGFHPSYRTHTDAGRWRAEHARLEAAFSCDIRGGRQHYLRWQNPETWRIWAEAGMAYDSTVGFAERPGFRCGTCREYPVFDLHRMEALALRERPLVLMEVSLFGAGYLNLGLGDEARALTAKLKQRCRAFGGDFTLLWHNNRLSPPERRFYRWALLEA